MDEPNTLRASGDSLGVELRKQREIRGISLKEIADATKISRRYLEALESDDHAILPAPVFTRGFVREFARHIGLDAEEMADRYSLFMTGGASGDDDEVSHSQPLPFIRVDRNIVIFAVLLLAFGVVVWWVWSHMGKPSVERSPVSTASMTETTAVPPVIDDLAEEVTSGEVVPAETAPDVLELRVTVTEDTWVILQVDGEASTNVVLRAGDVRTFSAVDEFRFDVIGNAGGIDLTLNGRPVPPMGPRGRVVRNVVFDWKVLEEMQMEATPHVD